MLGSVADAEDVVQDAALRLLAQNQPPESEEAYLYTVVTRLCIDRLRKQKTERKHYFGPWLPEPLPDEHLDPAEVHHDLGMGLMCLLDQLSPAERAGFVLREAFDFSYAEIADLLGVTASSARQRVSRARARMQRVDPAHHDRQQTPPQEQQLLLEKMMHCVSEVDAEGLIALMHEDVVALTDGGGFVSAAIAPVYGRQRITQVTLFLMQKSAVEGELEITYQRMNGGWAVVIWQDGQLHSCNSIEARDGKVHRIYVWRNPHKMRHLLEPAE